MERVSTDRLERLTVLLPNSQAKRLKHLAIDSRQSTSAVVRGALDDFMSKSDDLVERASRKREGRD